MLKGYYTQIPPTLAEVLAEIGNVSADEDFDTIVNAAVSTFFSFYSPEKLTTAQALKLEKFILNFFIMRRISSGNVKKWRQIFRNRWNQIIPFYERLIETQENESDYVNNPIRNIDTQREEIGTGTKTSDTDRDRSSTLQHTGEGTHTTDETGQKNHTGSFSENSSSTEINRYSDTPQGDSSDIWEVDGQGNPALTNIYLTDIRGITESSTRSGQDTAQESTTIDRDEATTDTYTDTGAENENTDYNEQTGHTTNNEDTGFSGVSPSRLLEEYRETFKRIYDDLCADLEPCFYGMVEVDDLIDFV